MSNEVISTNRPTRAMLILGRRIVQALVPAENAIDAAIADGAALLSTVASTRVESGLAAETGHESMETILRGLNALVHARAEFVLSHGQLTAVRDAQSMSGLELGCSATKRTIGAPLKRIAAAA